MSHLHADQRPRAADVGLKVFIIRFKRILGRVGTSAGGNLQSALVFKAVWEQKWRNVSSGSRGLWFSRWACWRTRKDRFVKSERATFWNRTWNVKGVRGQLSSAEEKEFELQDSLTYFYYLGRSGKSLYLGVMEKANMTSCTTIHHLHFHSFLLAAHVLHVTFWLFSSGHPPTSMFVPTCTIYMLCKAFLTVLIPGFWVWSRQQLLALWCAKALALNILTARFLPRSKNIHTCLKKKGRVLLHLSMKFRANSAKFEN